MSSISAQAASFSDDHGHWLNFEVQQGPDDLRSLTVKQGDGRVLLRLERGSDLRYLADMLNAVAPAPN
jgi:hypothetical protein